MWFVSLLLAAAPAGPASSALSFDEALRRASAAEDVAGAARAEQLRRDGQYFHVFTSNPQLVLQPALRAEAGVARPEGQVSLTQSLNVAGLGSARAGVQRADVAIAAAETRLLRQDRRLAVATAWVELWGAQEAARLAQEEALRVRELQERLERASASGGATRVELATTRAFAAELTALHLEWEGRRVEAGAVLAELLGVATLVEASGGLPQGADLDLAGLQAASLPLVQLARSEVAGERARLEESAAQWGTQLQFSVLGGHEAPTQWIAGVGVGLTLPLLEQGRRERTAHQAALEKLGAAQTLAERRAEVRLQVLQHELEHTAQTLRVVAGELLPAAEEAVTLETRRFAQGETTLLELTLLRRQALNARIAAALAQARFAGARARAREMVQP
jgi:outer membrane protein TolC